MNWFTGWVLSGVLFGFGAGWGLGLFWLGYLLYERKRGKQK